MLYYVLKLPLLKQLAFTEQMCDLLKSKVGSLEFLQKLNGIQKSVHQNSAGKPLLVLSKKKKPLLDEYIYYYKKYIRDDKNDWLKLPLQWI
jgi:hypothetical protein